ncbi:MAG TPA: S8 family serine peptidase [Thermoanaerobaculia bacterium]
MDPVPNVLVRPFVLLSLATVLVTAAAVAQPVAVTPTTCGTVDVPVNETIVERRLLGCGEGFAENVLWHLDRSDSISGAPNGKALRRTTGRGAVIYVMDTGVMRAHAEFQRPAGSNVLDGINAGGYAGCEAPDVAPCYLRDFPLQALFYGHGTSVASVAAGAHVGVAPDASIVPVLFRDPETLDRALYAIIRHAFEPTTPPFRTAVINLSLSLTQREQSPERDALFARMTRGVDADGNADPNGKRFLFTAAAGNRYAGRSSQCAPDGSVLLYPAILGPSIDGVVTVGGLDRSNELWSGSCAGAQVELLAPAAELLTASIIQPDTYRYKPDETSSGTSWAAPFAAGIAARMLEENPNLTPAELEAALKASPSRVGGLPVAVRVESAPPKPRRRAVGW